MKSTPRCCPKKSYWQYPRNLYCFGMGTIMSVAEQSAFYMLRALQVFSHAGPPRPWECRTRTSPRIPFAGQSFFFRERMLPQCPSRPKCHFVSGAHRCQAAPYVCLTGHRTKLLITEPELLGRKTRNSD